MVCPCHRCGLFAMARTGRSNAAANQLYMPSHRLWQLDNPLIVYMVTMMVYVCVGLKLEIPEQDKREVMTLEKLASLSLTIHVLSTEHLRHPLIRKECPECHDAPEFQSIMAHAQTMHSVYQALPPTKCMKNRDWNEARLSLHCVHVWGSPAGVL